MKIDFSKIKIEGLNGELVKDDKNVVVTGHKIVAQAIYTRIKILDLVATAFEINKGKPVELSKTDLTEIKSLFGPDSLITSFIRKAVIDFIDGQKES